MSDDLGPAIATLTAYFEASNERLTRDHIAICEIAAPPYGEQARGVDFARRLTQVGLVDVSTDAVGNVAGRYALGGPGPRLVVSAHLDTVFEADIDCTVRRDGNVLRAPGVSDDVSGLVILLAVAEALGQQQVPVTGELWFAATVGEEGAGNLRGARHLAEHGVAGRPIDAFITLDTSVPGHIVRHGTWSSNHELVLTGPGGHAWGQQGAVNPNLTMAAIVAKVAEYQPKKQRTSINCGLFHGGFAPNAIPDRTAARLNLRSEHGDEVARLVSHVNQAVADCLARANSARTEGPELGLEHHVTERPGGETPDDHPLVQAAVQAARRRGHEVSHPYSSTDANAFMAKAIPAICLYRGLGGGEHTLGEWYNATSRPAACAQLTEAILRYFSLS